jgi:hypothetical protein
MSNATQSALAMKTLLLKLQQTLHTSKCGEVTDLQVVYCA